MKILKRFFIDGLSGMAQGLFATLIIGTILEQVGLLIGGNIGQVLAVGAAAAKVLTGAGIGVGVASRFQESVLVTVSSACAGMIGAYASKIMAGTLIVKGAVVLSGPGEPLGAFLAAYVGIELGRLISGRTQLDILFTPLTTILSGGAVGLFLGPWISQLMARLGDLIRWGTEQQPFLMGIVVSVLMGMALTLPISSAALGVILNLSGIGCGSCCSWMQRSDDRICSGEFQREQGGRLNCSGNRYIDASGSKHRQKTADLDSADPHQCCAGTCFYYNIEDDKQCHWFRDGDSRISRADYGI